MTNHAGVLACIAEEPGVRLRELALRVDITERTAYAIVNELEADGSLTATRSAHANFHEPAPRSAAAPARRIETVSIGAATYAYCSIATHEAADQST